MKPILLFLMISAFWNIEGQACMKDRIIDADKAWGIHQIDSFHFTPHGGFAFLNDGSSWKINPAESEWIKEHEPLLLNTPLTIMPEAGAEHYPLRVIIHSEREHGWVDFTVEYLSPPNEKEASYILKQSEDCLEISIPLQETAIQLTLLINPHDFKTLEKWKKGQKVMIGGAWLPEYDINGPKDYNCDYPYVLFNYNAGNYVFFTIISDHAK
ncbi:hypothetical protein [Waddlia chondrophila]|uniref:hypothetical protein n=1 Tax=Waddlia chondrophila TaxID=71667 RepID=UPI0002F13B41|nr:hypothetical protein [Waddlia chondrophila]